MLRHVTIALLVVAGPLAAAGGAPGQDAPENAIMALQVVEAAAVPGREAGISGATATVEGAAAPMAVSGPGGVMVLAFNQAEFPVSLVISHPLYRDLATTVDFDGQLSPLFPDNQRELERRVGHLDVTVVGAAGPVAGAAVEAVGAATATTGGCTTSDAGTCSLEILWDVYELTAAGTTGSRAVVLPDQTTSAALVAVAVPGVPPCDDDPATQAPTCQDLACSQAPQVDPCPPDPGPCEPADLSCREDFVCTTAGQPSGCIDDVCDTSAPAGCAEACSPTAGVCDPGMATLRAVEVRTHFVSGGAVTGKGPTGRWLIMTPVLGSPPIEAVQGDAQDHVDLEVGTADGTWRILFQPFGAGAVFHAYRLELVFEEGESCWSPVIERPVATYASAPWAAPWVVNAHIADAELGCESFMAEPQPTPNGPVTGSPQALSHARYFGGA